MKATAKVSVSMFLDPLLLSDSIQVQHVSSQDSGLDVHAKWLGFDT